MLASVLRDISEGGRKSLINRCLLAKAGQLKKNLPPLISLEGVTEEAKIHQFLEANARILPETGHFIAKGPSVWHRGTSTIGLALM